ncbi:TPA: hypothetical protein ACRNS5_004224 [Pseudomonas aeruginosa]
MSELNKESVEQAGGDERAAFEAWFAQAMSHHFDPDIDLAKYEDSGEYRYNPAADYWKAWQARAALAQPSPAQAEQHWPKLEKPAQVGAIRFSAGVSSRLVVEAAQRLYEFESTPEKEAERIERLQAFREQCFEPLGTEFSKVLSENLVELSSDAKPEQAEAERPEVVARVVHSNPVVLGQCGPLNANDELMTVAQHAASVARWAEMFNRVEQERDAALASFKNFHRLLCERFGYTHDEKDWQRDQLSLIEHIAVAQAQHSVPEGYALVPLEPTDDMLVAGQEAWAHKMERRGALEDCEEAGDVYRAMLAAAPGKEVGHE